MRERGETFQRPLNTAWTAYGTGLVSEGEGETLQALQIARSYLEPDRCAGERVRHSQVPSSTARGKDYRSNRMGK